eukprot:TRINITY_DN72615_c0_g1_i1.p1 TRINITY_DN72615_c0_g1~~TRINITY_DN72615_c0_g1_i1.p1  ORF type:complete len:232 (-),score=31.41 TRINITY_DN72615_c0_g1_i1:226-921(-)
MPVNFLCPVCRSVSLIVDGGNATINGNVNIVTDFPPPTWNMQFAKFTDHDVFLIPDGNNGAGDDGYGGGGGSGGAGGRITASLGNMGLQPGDWLMTAGTLGDLYYHHFLYIGNGSFVSRQRRGVVHEGREVYNGKKATLVQGAANEAFSRVGEGGYHLVTNNCEHFCSEVCGRGHSSEQVVVGSGKLLATTLQLLGNAIRSEGSSWHFVGGTTGGFSAGRGGFSAGVRFNL